MRDETKMDANRLIAEVYKRPALWNQRHISYHNRDVTNRVWMEIAALLKLPKQLLKTKWKGLRDTFRAELKKEQAYRKTKFTRNRPIWIHFKTLQFLKEQMLPRPPIWERANFPTADRNNDASRDESSGGGVGNKPLARTVLRRRLNNNNSGSRIVTATDTTIRNNRRRGARTSARTVNENREICCDNVMTSLMIVEGDEASADIVDNDNSINNDRNKRLQNLSSLQVKLEPLEHGELNIGEAIIGHNHHENNVTTDLVQSSAVSIGGETPFETGDINVIDPLEVAINSRYDDNYYFLVSLLPHIRSLPAERRMLLRMQMQQLVYQEVYKKSSPPIVNQRIIATTPSHSARGSSSPLPDKQS